MENAKLIQIVSVETNSWKIFLPQLLKIAVLQFSEHIYLNELFPNRSIGWRSLVY